MTRTSTTTEPRRRRQRGSISAEEIVKGAFDVARADSLDKLSMPSLAEHLDVGVTSIYWYFRKKEDLLNAMTDQAMDRFTAALTPLDDLRWQDALTLHFTEMRSLFLADQTLSDLLLIRISTYGKAAAHQSFVNTERVLEVLVDAGFSPVQALRVFNTISVYTRGLIMADRILRLSDAPILDNRRQTRMTDWTDMPVLSELVADYPLAGTSDEDFAFGLGRLLCGFEVLLAEKGRPATRRIAPAKR